MSETLKKILIAIGGVLTGIIAFLFGRGVRNNSKRTESVEDDIDTAKDGISKAEGSATDLESTIDDSKRTASTIKDSTDNIERDTDECLSIIENIENRGTKKKD